MPTRAAVLSLLLAACWREGPGPAPPPLRPEVTPDPDAARRSSGWRPSNSAETTPQPGTPAQSPVEIGQQLAIELRANGGQLMPSYVAGPIVVLDLDKGSLTVECDATAINAANAWGLMFVDPARPRPHCRGTGSYTCTQFATQQVLMVEFEDPDAWRIVSVIVGNFRSGRSTMSAKIGQMRAQIATAACP